MAELPFLPLAIDAYLADCGHLSDAEHGRYLLLLMELWRAPRQRLPNDDAWLGRRFRRSEEAVRAELRPLISEFCKSDGNWITQKRLSKEFDRARGVTKQRSDAAKALWRKRKLERERIRENTHPRSAPADEPTPTPTPTPTKKESKEDLEHAPSPEAAAVDVWNDAASRVGWPKVQRLTEPRRKAVRARLADVGGLEGWQNAIAKAEASSFLIGRSGRTGEHANWQCGLDFILRESTFTKLMEGGFDDRPGTSNGQQSSHERQRQALAEWSREGDR